MIKPIMPSPIPLLPSAHKKTLFLGVLKTIIQVSLYPPPNGHDFTLDWVTQEKTWKLYIILRPGLNEFLQAAKKASFEIVTFTTWSGGGFVSQILHRIDPTGDIIITHRLFRDSCVNIKMGKIKDLTLTGRSLDRSVIIDHKLKAYVRPWYNAIKVSAFTGDVNDVELWGLLSFFTAQENFIDLRILVNIFSCAPPMPGLPLPKTTRKTLFLDLDETLICHVNGKPPDRYDFVIGACYVTKRPGVDKLLQMARDNAYEIVIFTAGGRTYASPIIDQLDPTGLITHRLYRDSCKWNARGKIVKDLALTGRSLDRCIIIDDKRERVLQTENVVMVKPFTGNTQDSELARLLLFFQIESRYQHLRAAARYVNELFFSICEQELFLLA